MLFDNALGFPYLKRFKFEVTAKPQRFVGSDEGGKIMLLTDKPGAQLLVTFGGDDAVRPPLEIDAESFIALKSFKAKGKRLTQYNVASIEDVTPEPEPTEEETAEFIEPEAEEVSAEEVSAEEVSAEEVSAENKQPSLFDDLD